MVGKKRKGRKGQVLALFGGVTAVVLMPTTIVLLVGMLPTVVATFFDTAKKKTRAMTVGFINFAGCSPFVLHLWSQGHEVENAVEIAFHPLSAIVMWSAAGTGYLIDWSLSGIVSKVMVERGKQRQEEITKQQEGLIERWGAEVTGEIPLDSYGFPVHTHLIDTIEEEDDKTEKNKN